MRIQTIGLLIIAAMGLAGCASNPSKAKNIETKMEKGEEITGDTSLGIKDGNMVVQKKVRMNEELRLLQNEVYGLEDKVYGNRKYGSEGLYGALKSCRKDLTNKKHGGDGKLIWTEPIERVTDKEEAWNVGVDEKEKIVGVTEEFLHERLNRFREYKRSLMKREDEYREKLEVCDAALDSKKFENEQKAANKNATPTKSETN